MPVLPFPAARQGRTRLVEKPRWAISPCRPALVYVREPLFRPFAYAFINEGEFKEGWHHLIRYEEGLLIRRLVRAPSGYRVNGEFYERVEVVGRVREWWVDDPRVSPTAEHWVITDESHSSGGLYDIPILNRTV